MLAHLVLPMSIGSAVGTAAGGYSVWAPSDAVRIVLAIILAFSAAKLLCNTDP
jgi:uncharacterized membrane protein YfcA